MKIIIEINDDVKLLNIDLDHHKLVHYSRYKNILSINAEEIFFSELEKIGNIQFFTKNETFVFNICEMSSSDPDATVIRCHILNH